MNVNQIINMVMRLIMRKAISKGIDAGMNRAARGMRGGGGAQPKRKLKDIPPEEMTEQQRIRAARRARRAARENGQS